MALTLLMTPALGIALVDNALAGEKAKCRGVRTWFEPSPWICFTITARKRPSMSPRNRDRKGHSVGSVVTITRQVREAGKAIQ
jgi:hypothetical protein